jgi:predicted NBD/HSP70 family sugar kinase
MNDANCFALSEATDGAGAGFDCVFGVILGTGVGGGITIGGACTSGANLIGGEVGPQSAAVARRSPSSRVRPATAGGAGCIET